MCLHRLLFVREYDFSLLQPVLTVMHACKHVGPQNLRGTAVATGGPRITCGRAFHATYCCSTVECSCLQTLILQRQAIKEDWKSHTSRSGVNTPVVSLAKIQQ